MSSCAIEVRISLYILALAGPLIAFFSLSPELLLSIKVPQWKKFSASKLLLSVLHHAAMLGFFIFLIYVFATAPRFGSLPKCNPDVKYVIFGIDTPATNSVFRGLFLASFSLLLLNIALTALLSCAAWAYEDDPDIIDEPPERFKQFMRFMEKFPGVEGMRIITDAAGRSYIIAMTEFMIQRNTVGVSGNDWGFGQIFAMIMLIGPFIELVSHISKSKDWDSDSDSESEDDGAEAAMANLAGFFLKPLIKIVACSFDFAFCGAAGAAAAASGAHYNGDAVTTYILQTGTLGGFISSGILNFAHFVSNGTKGTSSVACIFAVSHFGNAFAVSLAISNRVLGYAPNGILLGAVAGAGPLLIRCLFNLARDPNEVILKHGLLSPSLILYVAAGIGFDALAGYTFATVAADNGFVVCNPNAAAAAGAVYGIVCWTLRIPQWLMVKKLQAQPVKKKLMKALGVENNYEDEE